jgi:hypothetical protein
VCEVSQCEEEGERGVSTWRVCVLPLALFSRGGVCVR